MSEARNMSGRAGTRGKTATAPKAASAGAKKPAASRPAAKAGAKSAGVKSTGSRGATTTKKAPAAKAASSKAAPKAASSRTRSAAPRGAAKRGAATDRVDRNSAFELLIAEHDAIRKLFKKFERLEKQDADGEQKLAVAKEAMQLLMSHAEMEEKLLYPKLHEALGDDEDLVYEAEVEHQSAKELMAKIEAGDIEDDRVCAMVSVLGEYVEHHVQEEEQEIFKKCKRAKELDLIALGEEMIAYRQRGDGQDADADQAAMMADDMQDDDDEMPAVTAPPAARRSGGARGGAHATASAGGKRGSRAQAGSQEPSPGREDS